MKQRYIFIPIALLLLTSFACGLQRTGLDHTMTPSQTASPLSPSATPSPTYTLTPIPPTETPTFTETPTPIPPTPTNSPEPTIIPTECNNIFYPMFPGNEWTYEYKSANDTSQVSFSVDEVNDSSATLSSLTLKSGLVTQSEILCDNGAILNIPYSILGYIFGGIEGDVELEYVSGEFAPAESTLINANWDYFWETEFLANGNLQFENGGNAYTAILEDSPIVMNWRTPRNETTLHESIEVQAGIFPQAIRIERRLSMEIMLTITNNGGVQTLPTTLTFITTMWYEPYVGLVKQQVDQASASVFGVEFPIQGSATAELVKFSQKE